MVVVMMMVMIMMIMMVMMVGCLDHLQCEPHIITIRLNDLSTL